MFPSFSSSFLNCFFFPFYQREASVGNIPEENFYFLTLKQDNVRSMNIFFSLLPNILLFRINVC